MRALLVTVLLLAGFVAPPVGAMHLAGGPFETRILAVAPGAGAAGLSDPRPLPTASRVIPVGSDLKDLAMDPVRPRAYVADRWNGRVLVVNTTNASLAASLPVRLDPVALAIDPSASTLYVGHAGNFSILAIDLESLTVVRAIDTPFLTWDLAAPTDDTLVATTHDPGWSGGYPYVINATDGAVLQRPCDASCSLVYQDAIVAMSPDRTRLFFADTAVLPLSVRSFTWDAVLRVWAYDRTNPTPGELGAVAKDLAVDPSGDVLYLATAANSLLRVDAVNLTYAGTFGPFLQSSTVALSRTGHRVAMSPYEATAYLYDPSGLDLETYSFQQPVERLRATPDGTLFVALTGTNPNDIEVLETTKVQPIWPAVRVLPERRPPVIARLVSFAAAEDLTGTAEIDGAPVTSNLDPVTGYLTGYPSRDLEEGNHTARATARVGGALVGDVTWAFAVDVTPPSLVVDPVPSTSEAASLTVRGRTTDAYPVRVRVNGVAAATDLEGNFSARVDLKVGLNSIAVTAQDEAGNVARVSLSVDFQGLGDWFYQVDAQYRIRVPWNWYVRGNTTYNDAPVDVLMYDVNRIAVITIESEVSGARDAPAALAVLDALLGEFATTPGFRILEPGVFLEIDGHTAARATYVTMPTNFVLYHVVLLILGPEWGRSWLLSARMYPWHVGSIGSLVNASFASFNVLEAPPPSAPPPSEEPWLFLGVGIALVAAATAFVLLRRRTHG